MGENGEEWLGCFIDTLLHSAPWIIHHLDTGPNNIHTDARTHTKSPPLSLWVFIFRKSTFLTMFDASAHTSMLWQ